MAVYVERNEHGTLRVLETRVSLGSIVHAYWNGDAPEEIVQNFPSLSLERVHGALAYYLAHRTTVDEELKKVDLQLAQLRSAARDENRLLREKLLAARSARVAS